MMTIIIIAIMIVIIDNYIYTHTFDIQLYIYMGFDRCACCVDSGPGNCPPGKARAAWQSPDRKSMGRHCHRQSCAGQNGSP